MKNSRRPTTVLRTMLVLLSILLTGTVLAQNEPYIYVTGTTATFFHDSQRLTRTGGTTYKIGLSDDTPSWIIGGSGTIGSGTQLADVTTVNFSASFANVQPRKLRKWFYGMSNLTQISGLQYLNTAQVTNMAEMFRECSALTSLDLTTFNTEQVTEMQSMFYGCSSLQTIDLSTFNTEQVTDMRWMFYECSSLRYIYANNMEFGFQSLGTNKGQYMFEGCTNLCGQKGSLYDPAHTDQEYARVDDPASDRLGYFSNVPYAVVSTDGKTLTFYCDGNY